MHNAQKYTFLNERFPEVSKNDINGGNRVILYKLIFADDFE